MSAILFDLDGVLYEGDTAVEGAAEAVDWVVTNNIPHLFLTNTTSAALFSQVARENVLIIKIKASWLLMTSR